MPLGLTTIMTSTHSPQQDGVPMVVQELPLSLGERADIDDTPRLNAHPVQGGLVRDRRHNQRAGILEADEPAVEKMIDGGREQKAVLAI